GDQVARLSLVHRPGNRRVLLAQLDVDRYVTQLVAQRPAPLRRAEYRRRGGGERDAAAAKRHRGVVDRRQMPEARQLARRPQAPLKLLLVDERAPRRAKAVWRGEVLICVAVKSPGKTLQDDWRRR